MFTLNWLQSRGSVGGKHCHSILATSRRTWPNCSLVDQTLCHLKIDILLHCKRYLPHAKHIYSTLSFTSIKSIISYDSQRPQTNYPTPINNHISLLKWNSPQIISKKQLGLPIKSNVYFLWFIILWWLDRMAFVLEYQNDSVLRSTLFSILFLYLILFICTLTSQPHTTVVTLLFDILFCSSNIQVTLYILINLSPNKYISFRQSTFMLRVIMNY